MEGENKMKQDVKWITLDGTKEREEIIERLQKNPTLSALSRATLDILINRGVDTVEEAMMVLDNDIMNQHSPVLLKDMDKVVLHLNNAINEGKHIVIYGDFDCDGASATSIGMLCLRNLGAKVDYFINDRFIHGYGISPLGVQDLVKKYPTVDVIITVDNGIVAFDGVKEAIDQGIQVLITDHHEPLPDGTLPEADAVVNPKRLDATYPFSEICGATIIYKVMMCLYLERKESLDYVYSMVDLVGMATVGDVMPLINENRLFVKESIKQINKNPRYAFQALKEAIGQTSIDEGTFGFQIVPMINSIGRLDGKIDKAVDLFISTDKKEVDELVQYLVDTNLKRKEITAEQEALAISMVQRDGIQPVIVLAHESFHQGIVGLVAGRIKELYHRPTIVMTKADSGIWKGSGRSIEAFSLIDTLHQISPVLHHFGGHDMACGIGVEESNLNDFKSEMIRIANETLTSEDYIPKLLIDVTLKPSEVTEQLVLDLEKIKPFGSGFILPNLAVEDFSVSNVFRMGKEKQHIKLSNGPLSLIMWSGTDYYFKDLGQPYKIKAVGTPSLNFWNGKTSVQMIVKDRHLRSC